MTGWPSCPLKAVNIHLRSTNKTAKDGRSEGQRGKRLWSEMRDDNQWRLVTRRPEWLRKREKTCNNSQIARICPSHTCCARRPC